MSHMEEMIDQDSEQDQVKSPLLKAEFLKMNDMKEQQKEESFQSNKPCKNQDAPEFREFFEINDLKAQLQAKTTLICNLKNQIKSVKEASNEAKVKNDIDVIETINIELEHSVAKLLAANEQLHKENEHLKQTYKELYDSIKKTRVQNKDNSDSLISQINQKSVENADLKAQIQEKVFVNAALKNELRKLKGNSVDTKFAKASILGKPPLQPSRNHSVVRQPNAFKSERPRISKPRFASQVDEKNVLSKPVTPHYLPNVRESAPAKSHHVNAPSSSRNSQKDSYGSNDMAHNYFLEEARKKTQDRNRNLKPREMPSARTHHTPNTCTPRPRSNNQTFRNWPASKSTSNVKSGKNSVQSFKGKTRSLVTKKTDISYVRSSRNSNLMNMLQMTFGQNSSSLVLHQMMFGQNSSGLVLHLDDIRWQKRIFLHLNLQDEINRSFIAQTIYKIERETFSKSYKNIIEIYSAMLAQSPSRSKSEKRSKEIIKSKGNKWEADVVSEHFDRDDNAGDNNEETKPDPEEIYNSGPGPQLLTPRTISSGLVPQPPSPTPNVPPTKNDWDLLFCPMLDEYFNPSPSVVVVQEPVVSTGTPHINGI
ncbi:hypothetical protein Tco_0805607 [Tanacetum coccineum]